MSPVPFWLLKVDRSKDPPLIKKKKKKFLELQAAFIDCFMALLLFQPNQREYKGMRADAMIATGNTFKTATKEGKHPTYQRQRARDKAYKMLKDERTSRILRDKGLVYVRRKWQTPKTEKQHREVELFNEFKRVSKKGFLPTSDDGQTQCPNCGWTE